MELRNLVERLARPTRLTVFAKGEEAVYNLKCDKFVVYEDDSELYDYLDYEVKSIDASDDGELVIVCAGVELLR